MSNLKESLEPIMKKSLEFVKEQLATIRGGGVTPAFLESLKVDAYGANMSLSQVGTISNLDPRTLLVQVWDKGLVSEVEKSLRNMGFGPVIEGTSFRVPIPPLSKERREELVKILKKQGEEFRITFRNHRRVAMEELQKLKDTISEDTLRKDKTKIQEITDEFIKQVDLLLDKKEKEILSV